MPALTVAGALTVKCVAKAACTVIALLPPLRVLLCLSVAVRVALPAVTRVALKAPTPPVRVVPGGRVAAVSVLAYDRVPL